MDFYIMKPFGASYATTPPLASTQIKLETIETHVGR